ncbi:MAG: hypothetical protein IPK74_19170 [Deltaproteobacteria bacterium]|nr:hypothetical protein [Deltaproteobacteria bacterium]
MLRRDDFRLEFDEGGLTLTCLAAAQYRFEVLVAGEGFRSIECPGVLYEVDQRAYNDIGGLYSGVREWCLRVEEELAALPNIRLLIDLNERVERLEDVLQVFPDRVATEQELENLRERIDAWERKAAADMRAVSDRFDDVEAQLGKLHEELDAIRRVAGGLTIRAVVRAVVTRVWNYAKSPDSPAELAAAVESVKALTEGVTKIVGG